LITERSQNDLSPLHFRVHSLLSEDSPLVGEIPAVIADVEKR